MADEGVITFLDLYGEIVETAEQRPQKVHMIFHLANNTGDLTHKILTHRTLEGMN